LPRRGGTITPIGLAGSESWDAIEAGVRRALTAKQPPVRYWDPVFPAIMVMYDIAYGTAVDHAGNLVTLRLDLYEPVNDLTEGRPAIVWVHPDGSTAGSRAEPSIVDLATAFARMGYVGASISYRVHPAGGWDSTASESAIAMRDAQHDAQAAIRFLRARGADFGIDPDRIAVAGIATGGAVALRVAASPDDPGLSGTPGPSSGVAGAVSVSAADASATTAAGDTPSLLLRAGGDEWASLRRARSTLRKALAAVPASSEWQDEANALYWGRRTEVLAKTKTFMYSVLDLATFPDGGGRSRVSGRGRGAGRSAPRAGASRRR
jgi:acetyl esterase/lipase